jgi:hypothetical protein
MNSQDSRRHAYDLAQTMEERIERLQNQKGWSDVFIPMIQKARDDSQREINRIETPQREADLYRGKLQLCDEILEFCESKKKGAQHNMASNINPQG